ncbi:MAG TPA: hypothetical protein VEO19_09330, partial [Terriglobia bacterium]|nr:hypothetical protein [Terriglobia bacterium]
MKARFVILIIFLVLAEQRAVSQPQVKTAAQPGELAADTGLRVGVFQEEFRLEYTAKDGLPSDDVRSVAVTASSDVYAGTARGLTRFSAGKWATVAADGEAVEQAATSGDDVWFLSAGKLVGLHGQSFLLPSSKINQMVAGGRPLLASEAGLYVLANKIFVLDSSLARLLGSQPAVRQVAVAADGSIAVAALAGLFLKPVGGAWRAVYPRNATRSWAPYDVRGVAFDSKDRL